MGLVKGKGLVRALGVQFGDAASAHAVPDGGGESHNAAG
jgi:hypothetical protein